MLLTGHTRSSLHLAPSGNVCDGGKLCFSTSLILLWLTDSFRFKHIGLSMEIKRQAGYSQCDFRDEIVREICGFLEYADPPTYHPGRQRASLSKFETVHVPFSLNRRKTVSCAINRRKPGERFTPTVPPHNVRVNACMSPKSEIVFTSFIAGNTTANNVLLVSGAMCLYSLR